METEASSSVSVTQCYEAASGLQNLVLLLGLQHYCHLSAIHLDITHPEQSLTYHHRRRRITHNRHRRP
jgi:hypothetical protein